MLPGLKASIVMPRSCVCRGASIAMNDWAISVISGEKSSIVMPLAEENTFGLRLAALVSSYFVSDQNPFTFSSGGSRSDSAGRLQNTGFSSADSA